MQLGEYIACLERIREEHGDLLVDTYNAIDGSRRTALPPEVGYAKILEGKQRTPKFWLAVAHVEDLKGHKVCKV